MNPNEGVVEMCRVADFAPLRRQRVVQRRGRASCASD